MTAPELLALLHAQPELAAEVFDALKVAEAWQQLGPGEWRRYSLAFTGELDEYGKERPIARTFLGSDGRWRTTGSSFPGHLAARAAEDARLAETGWALVGGPTAEEVQW